MPELPEIENYRVILTERLAGDRITGVQVLQEKLLNVSAEQFDEALTNRTIWFVERRGKHLLLHLDNGKRLFAQLDAGASLFYGQGDERPQSEAQIVIQLETGSLYVVGMRQGFVHLLSVKETGQVLAELGPDPLDKRLTLEKFTQLFRKKRGALKAAMADQQVISGIGSFYADEIAYAAAVRPDIKIPLIQEEAWKRLYEAMHAVLKEAAGKGGSVEQPLTMDDKLTGGYYTQRRVYERAGEACGTCGTPIEVVGTAARKAFVCPSCQPEQEES
ncbi:DNA-formamidopyrimidine glycosylase family protein [Paenibacillus sp. FSL H8-0537]|uniref:Fpg/Nei family DNA glycosylase n=1 Tax=Paenibacillus sp. FSL H8-0537 TaxID=2921399 RepID=UPI003101A433